MKTGKKWLIKYIKAIYCESSNYTVSHLLASYLNYIKKEEGNYIVLVSH